MSALDSLQDGMASSAASLPAQRPGCPRMAAMRAAQAAQAAGQATLDQAALSYLAASRFGPGFMATVTQVLGCPAFLWEEAGCRNMGCRNDLPTVPASCPAWRVVAPMHPQAPHASMPMRRRWHWLY